jgi:chromate transport protein ChrA
VATSLGAAYAFDAAGLSGLARAALAPVYPMLLAVAGLAGGFHSASGETRWMVLTALVSVVVWWGLISGWRRWRTRLSP